MKYGYTAFLLAFALLFAPSVNAQTTLNPGDLVIINVQADTPDTFIFIPMVDLAAGTVVYFTDCGVSSAGAFASPCNEGAQVYTAPGGGIAAGTIITWTSGASNFASYTDTRITGSLDLAVAGDQIFAFQDSNTGNATPPGEEPSLIFGVNNASSGTSNCDESDAQQTDAPTVLTGASAYLPLGSGTGCEDEFDNTIYDAATHGLSFASPAAAYTTFTTLGNWIGRNNLTGEYATASTAITNAGGSATLPVELTAFDALAAGNTVLLQWTTASETNNAGFSVEMKTPVQGWQELTFVEGFGTSSTPQRYRHHIADMIPGVYQFRLRQIDFDGAFAYSPEVEVVIGLTEAFHLTAPYPNPTSASTSVSLMVPRAQNVTVVLYDLLGRQVATLHDGTLEAHHAKALVLNAANFANGLYLIRAEGEAFVATQRLVIAH